MNREELHKETMKRLALRIKQLRKQKNITQEAFYFDTGIHIGRIERGKRNISFTTLVDICIYFDMSLEEFFKGFEPIGS